MFQFAPIDPRITHLLEKRAKGNRSACLDGERTKILTDYFKAHEAEPYDLKWAHFLYEWCAKKTIRVFEDDIFVGNMGRSYRDLLLFVEWNPTWLYDLSHDPDDARFKKAWQSPGSFPPRQGRRKSRGPDHGGPLRLGGRGAQRAWRRRRSLPP